MTVFIIFSSFQRHCDCLKENGPKGSYFWVIGPLLVELFKKVQDLWSYWKRYATGWALRFKILSHSHFSLTLGFLLTDQCMLSAIVPTPRLPLSHHAYQYDSHEFLLWNYKPNKLFFFLYVALVMVSFCSHRKVIKTDAVSWDLVSKQRNDKTPHLFHTHSTSIHILSLKTL